MTLRSTVGSTVPWTRRRWPPATSISIVPAAGAGCEGPTGPGKASGTNMGGEDDVTEGSVICASRRHRNKRLEWMACRRATIETVAPSSAASANIVRLSSSDQTRRVVAVTTCGGFVLSPDMVPIQSQMGPSVSSPQPYRCKAPVTERLRLSRSFRQPGWVVAAFAKKDNTAGWSAEYYRLLLASGRSRPKMLSFACRNTVRHRVDCRKNPCKYRTRRRL